jgi:SAM-dependent MidA family methyltransferase
MTISVPRSNLPPLSDDEKRHSAAAAELIRHEIEACAGWLSFERFMELALYAPGVGYYSAGSVKVGSGGDFVTAPEISDLFSRCVARQCADILSETGGEILELGAGTGRMAAVILESLHALGQLPERYAILEVSADLADRQTTLLRRLPAQLSKRVVWLDRLPADPIRGVVLANEVLDALPFRRFVVRAGEARELGVALHEDSFVWRESSTESAWGAALLRELSFALPEGYTSEIGLNVEPWLGSVGRCIEHGALLLFDYGLPRSHYYHPQRIDGTLLCHFKQRAHADPFINVAVQDITGWVDFTRVAEAALVADLEVSGFATQAAFLLGTGIERLMVGASGSVEQARLAGEARRLLLPGEMGEAFKVMALSRRLQRPLSGFMYQDLRPSL